jgi:hypothetical protein
MRTYERGVEAETFCPAHWRHRDRARRLSPGLAAAGLRQRRRHAQHRPTNAGRPRGMSEPPSAERIAEGT